MSTKMWGGRFESETDGFAAGFHSSISFDCRLYLADIQGSMAHARMLGEAGIISKADSAAIIDGLIGILADIENGRVQFDTGDEDIHMNIERLLTERIGEAGKRLHTGRSRNDQVALDVRLFLMQACDETTKRLKALMDVLCGIAEQQIGRAHV